jgi:hypothetical protein
VPRTKCRSRVCHAAAQASKTRHVRAVVARLARTLGPHTGSPTLPGRARSVIDIHMTQIISAITDDYVLLAADRCITSFESGDVLEDDTCKMVNIQNNCGVAYTGISRVGGKETCEWIAVTLAKAKCTQIGDCMPVLLDAASSAFRTIPKSRSRHTFVLCGWSAIKD